MSDPGNAVPVTFRRANRGDIAILVEYNLRLASETESKDLAPSVLYEGVASGMDRHPEVQYFVAESEGRVIGQLMFTREWSDWRNGWMLWLQSVYINNDCRGQGIFRGLLDYAVKVVDKNGQTAGMRLYVDTANAAAISAYEHLGFTDAGYRILEVVQAT